ncbi:MAG TPA: hypothetical protein VKW04_09965 [Planctomycetota bacterium]|nr:hypothetical protein [Planctomycetota bacterium]
MSLPPGLLPESTEARPSRAPLLLGTLLAVALSAVLILWIQNRKLAGERDAVVGGETSPRKTRLPDPPPAAAESPVPLAPLPAPGEGSVPIAPSVNRPPRAAKVRVLPEDPEFLSRGLQEFRQARYDQAERQFFRAIPESFLYLALTSLAQRNWKEALAFLSQAMGSDPQWLQRVNPRDLFGASADFDALVQALDEQLAKAPTDADLKTLAAYVRYHEKGAPYAKALLVEATTVNPGHEAAKAFLEALGP